MARLGPANATISLFRRQATRSVLAPSRGVAIAVRPPGPLVSTPNAVIYLLNHLDQALSGIDTGP